MPGKKKGKKGGKAKAENKDGRLPPPPDFSDNRQGALEALLSYRIRGKQDVIDVYVEEGEVYKDRNHQQRQKNYVINREKARNLDTLIQEAKEFEKKLSQSETVGREDVEKAMLDKLDFMRKAREELVSLEVAIQTENQKLQEAYEELARLRDYRDNTQYERKDYITSMKEAMASWEKIEQQIESQLTEEIRISNLRVDQKLSVLAEVQKEKISERLLQAMDDSAKGEITDNSWLKQQISLLQEQEKRLQEEVDSLERRNLEVMEGIYSTQHLELEAAQKLFSVPGNHPTSLATSSSDLLVSRSSSRNKLVSRQLDLGLLSVEGATIHLRPIPEQVHLPPIIEQHSHGIPRPSWPVTGKMLKTIIA